MKKKEHYRLHCIRVLPNRSSHVLSNERSLTNKIMATLTFRRSWHKYLIWLALFYHRWIVRILDNVNDYSFATILVESMWKYSETCALSFWFIYSFNIRLNIISCNRDSFTTLVCRLLHIMHREDNDLHILARMFVLSSCFLLFMWFC